LLPADQPKSWSTPGENPAITGRDMAKAADAMTEGDNEQGQDQEQETPEIDSKYRMIIVAAQRSKQLQRGARPRVELDSQRHKSTRIALEEVQRGLVPFRIIEKE
jgi:DNA-directed RNA polymerase subunit omega